MAVSLLSSRKRNATMSLNMKRLTLKRSTGGHDFEDIESKTLVSRGQTLSHGLALSALGYTPLPNRLHARMKYVSVVTLSSGVTPGVNVFSANGLYDPDVTGTGHQPRGFDQLIALYDHYVVTKSMCKVEFSGGSSRQVGGIQLQSSSTAQSDYIDYAEQARCTYNVLPYYITSGGIQEPKTHEMKFIATEFMGIPDPITSDKLQGSVSANPSDQAFFHVFSQHIDGSTSAVQQALVTIVYDVTFIEPVPVASS